MSGMNESPEAAALRAIRETHKHPKKLSASGELSWRKWRSSASILRTPGPLFLERRGRFVWRTKGKAGADLPKHPLAIEIENLEKKHRTEINKVERFLRLLAANKNKSGVSARKVKTDLVKETIFQLVRNAPARHHGRNLSGYLSKQTGLSRRQIQRYLYQKKAT